MLPVHGVHGGGQGWGGSGTTPRLTHNGEGKSRAQKPTPRRFGLQQGQKRQASATALLNANWMEAAGPCLLFTAGPGAEMGVNNPAGPQDPGSSRGVWRSAPHPKPLPLRTSAKSRDVCHSPRAHCRDGEARCSQAGLSFNISNLLQLFTSTAKSQRKLILQRACLCKLCRSSNINSMILAYNFSNLMFSWPRTSPRNWRWKQLQKAWPTAQHSLKRSQRGRRSQPCGQTSTPSLQLTPTRPTDSGQASALPLVHTLHPAVCSYVPRVINRDVLQSW